MGDSVTTLDIPVEQNIETLQRRLKKVRRLIAAPNAEARQRVRLVLVHEVLRRRLEAAASTSPEEAALFDAKRWDQGDHGRLAAYEALIGRVRERTIATVPAGAHVAMVSRGDDRLLQLDDRIAVHFPQQAEGHYAGFYPKDADEAIAQLAALRSGGTQYVVFPATAFWWLDFYSGLARWLAPSAVWACGDCSVFELARAREGKEDTA
jgi:hypothetical protein